MRAAILREVGGTPQVGEFEDPGDTDVVEVRLAGLNPVDLILASGARGDPTTPSVVGQEGIGAFPDGRRVYFNSPPDPFGSWAQRSRIDSDQAFPIPDEVDDELAVALGIPGLAAWIPLTRHARVKAGESVLVLGATGVVGQIAVQAARILGAGRVVGAGRDADALEQLHGLGADATVVLGQGDDAEALKAAAGDGFAVVIDTVYGDPFLAALGATANGARLVTIGAGAGDSAEVPFRSLMGRTHIGHGNNMTAPEELRAAYAELMEHAAQGQIKVEVKRYSLDQAAEAWQAQSEGLHLKLVVAP